MDENNYQTTLSDFLPVKVHATPAGTQEKKDRRTTVLALLKNLRKNATFLKGRVIAVRSISSKTAESVPCLVLEILHPALKKTDRVSAVIPFGSVFPITPLIRIEEKDETETESIKIGVLSKMMGAEVNFIITRDSNVLDPEKNVIVVGNRVLAMRMIRELCFGERHMVKDGGIYQGKIVSKSPQTLVVELGGIEKPFHKHHVTSRYIPDFTSPDVPEEFKIGAPIDVYVDQTRLMENGEYTANFNLILAEQEKTKEIRQSLEVGTKATATVAHIDVRTVNGAQVTNIYGWLEYGCACKLTNVTTSLGKELPKPGDIVSCIIKKVCPDTVIVSMRDVTGRA